MLENPDKYIVNLDENEPIFNPFIRSNTQSYQIPSPTPAISAEPEDIDHEESECIEFAAKFHYRHFKPKFHPEHQLFFQDFILRQEYVENLIQKIQSDRHCHGMILLTCCEKNFIEVVDFLINNGAPLNYCTSKRQNVFHLSLKNPDNAISLMLLDFLNNSDKKLLIYLLAEKDCDQNTPIKIARNTNNLKFLSKLAFYGIDIDSAIYS